MPYTSLGSEIDATGKVLVVAEASHAALAVDGQVKDAGQSGPNRRSVAGKEIHRVASAWRHVVADHTRPPCPVFQAARVQAGDMIQGEQVGMLQPAPVRLARLRCVLSG
jgi:hypothetical protein